MKTCKKCGLSKPVEEFAKKSKTLQHAHCKKCQTEINKQHYSLNKEKVLRNSKDLYSKRRAFLDNLKKGKACKDCGIVYNTWQLDFDLLDPKTKIFHLSGMVSKRFTEKQILEEVEKCDIVCANCHRNRTHKRIYGELAESG